MTSVAGLNLRLIVLHGCRDEVNIGHVSLLRWRNQPLLLVSMQHPGRGNVEVNTWLPASGAWIECDGYLHNDTAAVAKGSSVKRKSKGVHGVGKVAMMVSQAMVCTMTLRTKATPEQP